MWETIVSEETTAINACYVFSAVTSRMKVDGGWLVRVVVKGSASDSSTTVSTTFLPDPNHDWKLPEENK